MNARRDRFIGLDRESGREMRSWFSVAIVSLALGSGGAVYGQTNAADTQRPYLGGSVFVSHLPAYRERRNPAATSSTSEADGIGSSGPGGAIVFGSGLSPHFAIEGEWSVAPKMRAYQARSLHSFTTNHRDQIISALVSYRPAPARRVSLEPVAGLSVAYGSTRLTNVQEFRTFCDGGVRHCAVPVPDVALGPQRVLGICRGTADRNTHECPNCNRPIDTCRSLV
jgi:hypothetical protein